MREILIYFSDNINNIILEVLKQNQGAKIEDNLQEIRIRINRPIILKLRDIDICINYIVTERDIMQTLEKLCQNSLYAYKKQISEGYITIQGGHRIGITGTGVIEDDKIVNLKYISSLNFRIAREIKGCSKKILKEIINLNENTIYNTVLVSPPGKGKTTMLRDIVRNISNGIEEISFNGKTCGVVDERGEIAACYRGIPQKDIGIRTDVIENVSKEKGILMLLRSMAPEVIACDEIGSKEDVQAIEKLTISGVKGIFTMHGRTIEDVKNNHEVNKLLEKNFLEKIIFI